MKFSMKAVAASVLFAIAGGSQAAILNGNDAFGYQGDGELFISIFRDDASPASMIIDTGLSLFNIRSGATTGWTSSAAQTAAIQAFLSTGALSDFRFNAGGTTGQEDVFNETTNADFAAWFTSNAAVTINNVPNTASGVDTVRSNTGVFITEINNAYDELPSFINDGYVSGILPGQAGFHNAPSWGPFAGSSVTNTNTEAGVGTDLALWNLFTSCTELFCEGFSIQQFGFMSVNGATGVASFDNGATTVIPVPAAVWLLGSGLVGLVGVARRRKA